MAYTVPETLASVDSRVMPGERKVFVALREHLPEDYLVYYDIPVDGRYPDFIVVGPDLGLVVLEVKDWRLKSILEITADRIRLRQAEGELEVWNPVRQVRDYLLRTVDALKRRPRLCVDNQLCCGWGCGVVLPYLTPDEVRQPSLFGPSLEQALGAGLVLTDSDLAPEVLLPRLRGLIPARGAARGSLDAQQLDEIRSVLHPEIRIGWGATGEGIVRVMDLEQERLARTLGDGHRLLRGVAGSGKTIALICRARYLRAQHPAWRILVVCYNRVLAEFLRTAIGDESVDVSTFHAWCTRQLKAACIEVPEPPGRGQQWDAFWVETVPQMLSEAFDTARVPAAAYQAILVDEGQDFADSWYRLLLRALDPQTNRLFIALDSSQNIYRRSISWRALGIQISGRTRVLKRNYRNTRPILTAAYGMVRELDAAEADPGDLVSSLVVPDQALREGPAPELEVLNSAESVRRHAKNWIGARLSRGISPGDILVLGHNRLGMEKLAGWLERQEIPASFLPARKADGTVGVSTIHSSKGLDAGHVLIVNAHELDGLRTRGEARRLLYIAMTRARDELCISSARPSWIMDEVAKVLQVEPRRGTTRGDARRR
ncbi:MAG TPA: UvrD-helicase domain-containing protein [Methylomirabilota bacterium]|nr:UvrD-helicase domain-containing protein [Methylomirabilota bacterium]